MNIAELSVKSIEKHGEYESLYYACIMKEGGIQIRN